MNAIATEQNTPAEETFVIAKTDEGFRVCSPLNPGRQFVVTGVPDAPRCTCPDFAQMDGDPAQTCRHVAAVLKELGSLNRPATSAAPAETSGRGSAEPPTPVQKQAANGRNGTGAVMLLKRSVSPDGRIDSLSVEFSCPVGKATSEEIKQRASKMLTLQAEIASGFLKSNGNGKPRNGNGGAQSGNAMPQNGDANAVPGQMLAVASMASKWGRRLFINVVVNGQVLKLFGSEKQLAEAVTAAGFPDLARQVADGVTLNLPCRVITKPSPDGKYVNIERVFPAQAAAPARS